MKLNEKSLRQIIKEELRSFLVESYASNRSKIDYKDPIARGLVYRRPYGESETPPIPPRMVRTAGIFGQGPRKPKNWQENHVEILITQPGYKVMEDVPVSDPRGAAELQRQMDQIEKSYQDTLERLGPDEPDKNEDWNAWYTWKSQSIQNSESYNYEKRKLEDTQTVKLPLEYGKGPLTTITHSILIDGSQVSPGPEGEYIDVPSWILQKKKITNKFGALLDFNGREIASKKLQSIISNAAGSQTNKRRRRKGMDDSGNPI